MATEPTRVAAIGEAAGAIPVLRENEVVNAQVVLALGNMIEERWASEWWDDFAKVFIAAFALQSDIAKPMTDVRPRVRFPFDATRVSCSRAKSMAPLGMNPDT
jgi:hypothetical protein